MSPKSVAAGKRVGVVSLGCDKNRVDTETMLYRLAERGYAFTVNPKDADLLIVNTCAFIESARKEAVDAILDMAEVKCGSKEKKLIVTGCLPQKHLVEIEDEFPEVDAFLGVRDYDKIADIADALFGGKSRIIQIGGCDVPENENRYLTTPMHYAFLRIADGCDNHCTYCTIPSIRGTYQSRSMESLVREATNLIENGVRELILVAQDVTRYGIDRYGDYRLVDLLKKLSNETDVSTIRLMYCYPELVTDELLDEIANNPKIAKYLDIPFQHADDRILKLMNRRSTGDSLCALMQKIRAMKPYIAVRTTFMVGFPSETEAEFENLYRFVEIYQPDHVGVFAYSKEPGTPSARIKGHLPKSVKLDRVNRLGELHLKNCRERNRKLIGKTVSVVYEGIDYERNLFIGRTRYSAPDIDTFVYFSGSFADVGNIYEVRVTDYDDYDLIGELVES